MPNQIKPADYALGVITTYHFWLSIKIYTQPKLDFYTTFKNKYTPMEKLVGRAAERKILEDVLASSGAELVAMYGRRRVGKTFLIRSVHEKYIRFEFIGVHNASIEEQLENFSFAIKKAKTWCVKRGV